MQSSGVEPSSTMGALQVSDEIAIERVCAGEVQAYEIIMRRYNHHLFRAARSILKDNDEAQDAVQEAYIRAY